ncbi:MAG: hypothetical protein ACLRQY_02295 [[Clostridium] leptum]
MSETYESILSRMQDQFQELAGFPADDASDIGIRLKVLAGELFSACTNLDWLKRQVFPQTAQGIQLDYHAQQNHGKAPSVLRTWNFPGRPPCCTM